MDVLQDAVDAGAASNFSLSVYDYYRGEAIQYVLTQYRNIETFEEMIALTSETPKNKQNLPRHFVLTATTIRNLLRMSRIWWHRNL